MPKQITKRDGTVVSFDINRIINAIDKANKAIDGGMSDREIRDAAESVAERLDQYLEDIGKEPTVEACQDLVEEELAEGHLPVARAYMIYRAGRARIRRAVDTLALVYDEIAGKPVSESDVMRENANIDSNTAMGAMLKYGSEGAKWYVDESILPRHIAEAHKSGDIHIHDKDFYLLTETCCQIDLTSLFKNGFSTGHGFLREPNSIESYAALACIAIQANQNEMHGGQSIPAFDYDMAHGVRKTWRKEFMDALSIWNELEPDERVELPWNFDKATDARATVKMLLKSGKRGMAWSFERADKRTERRTYQAMESFVHNLNTMHSRSGGQVPFSSVNYGTDTSWAGRLVTRQLLLTTQAGLGNGETAIFPVQIFKVRSGCNYNPADPNYDLFMLSIKVSAQRMFPNYSFLDAPFNAQYLRGSDPAYEVAVMGCRTRVMANVHKEGERTFGRGNLSFTTINLPRIALESEGNIDRFMEILQKRMELVREQLLHRLKIQSSRRVFNYPFLMGNGIWIDSHKLDWNDTVGEVLKHGTLTIGFIGLAEALTVLTGHHHGESPEAQKLGLEIIGKMRGFCDAECAKGQYNFSLIGTPAEGLAGRFPKLDRERFGTIPGVNDRDYYTNSFHVPVWHKMRAVDKIRTEAPYHALCNGGHITYVELDGDMAMNEKAFLSIIKCMRDSGVGYGSINHPLDRDPVCGYVGVIGDVCPRCGRRSGEPVSEKKLREIRRKFGNRR